MKFIRTLNDRYVVASMMVTLHKAEDGTWILTTVDHRTFAIGPEVAEELLGSIDDDRAARLAELAEG